MKKKKLGYTLIELLITMGIIGVIAAILIPILQNSMPGRDKAFVRKCYFTTKNTLYLMLNNPTLYSTDDRLAASNVATFATNFKSYLKTSDGLSTSDSHFAKTADGVDWYYTGNWSSGVIIYFDVNGAENTPNCTQYTSFPTGYSACTTGVNPDTYAISVRSDGKLGINPGKQTYMASILSDATNIRRE